MYSFDIIIAGAGAAGLNLALALIDRQYSGSVLILDSDKKNKNDRTWCFWAEADEELNEVIYKKWNTLEFKSKYAHLFEDINPMTYNMIRSKDFYDYAFKIIEKHKNYYFKKEIVNRIDKSGKVITEQNEYSANFVFNSVLDYNKLNKNKNNIYLLQHFLGYFINTKEHCFDPDKATYMDFSIDQQGDCRFIYILPLSSNNALVEYTIFSKELLQKNQYRELLTNYIKNDLNIAEYEIQEEEFGIIPMTDHPFAHKVSENLINIGTAGGFVKASTGYSFLRSRRAAKEIAFKLVLGQFPIKSTSTWMKRFKIYDSVLLEVLSKKLYPADKIFEGIFKRNGIKKVLRFLDEQTNFAEELLIMNSTPKFKFMKATFSRIKELKSIFG